MGQPEAIWSSPAGMAAILKLYTNPPAQAGELEQLVATLVPLDGGERKLEQLEATLAPLVGGERQLLATLAPVRIGGHPG